MARLSWWERNSTTLWPAMRDMYVFLCWQTTTVGLGLPVDGTNAGDQAGRAIALSFDGSIMAVSSYLHDGNGEDSGQVRVFVWRQNMWVQRGSPINGESAFDLSGHYSLALSSDGTVLAIPGYQNDGNGPNSGHVRVFVWSGTDWTQRGLDIEGEAGNDRFGRSVSLSSSGTILAVGALFNNGGGSNSGHARVFRWTGTSWDQIGRDLDGPSSSDRFGSSVSLSSSGSVLAVGGDRYNINGMLSNDVGIARVFGFDGNQWVQMGQDIVGMLLGDRLGFALSLSADGHTVLVGAYRNSANGDRSGTARAYRYYPRLQQWIQLGQSMNGLSDREEAGYGVALSADGTRAVVGAPQNLQNGPGIVRVYDLV